MSYILEYLYLTDKKFSMYIQHNENHQLLKMQNVGVLYYAFEISNILLVKHVTFFDL